jgi:hypothetical protein
MAFSNAALNKATDAITGAAGGCFMGLHSADPGVNGTTAAVGTRQPVTFPAASGSGDATSPAVNFTALGTNQPVTFVSLWTASAGGTFLGAWALTGDQLANAAGAYTVTSLAVNASAP